MKLRSKKTGTICHASSFNTNAINEIIVCFEDDQTSDFIHDYEVWVGGTWKCLGEAFKDHDVITDNYNTCFFEPENDEERKRGYQI